MTPTPGSATPEGKPTTPDEFALERIGAYDGPSPVTWRELSKWISERDALHAETERVMREALTQIAEYEIDWREGPGYNIGVLQQRAEDALATAQAMKEGTNEGT